jgi:DNA-binding MarR family transcriptional regulator
LQDRQSEYNKAFAAYGEEGAYKARNGRVGQRNKVCYLTDEGQSKIPELQETLDKWEAAALKDVSEEDC